MIRPLALIAIAVIFLSVGVASAAAVLVFLPNSGSAPAIFDDFNWSSTSNGFWHVNAVGATTKIKHSIITLTGDSIELDRRIQTDPVETVIVAKVRGLSFHKFGLGIGVYHSGTVGIEFDDDGVKCGRGTDQGWQVNIMKAWSRPPINKWFYVEMDVKNPYPNWTPEQLSKIKTEKLKHVTLVCTLYDSSGNVVSRTIPRVPPPNAHYVSFDEAFFRTWDSGNKYQVDWFYAGPKSGIPRDFKPH